MWHKSTGIICYDPPRPGMKRKTEWWAVVNIDKEITRYYRWWVKNRYWIDLYKPSWNGHISIVRGERPPRDKVHLWKKYDKKHVSFYYSHQVKRAKKPEFWIVDVYCPFLTKIRNEFGFPSNWNLHITIGKENA